jgi:hypothetical protein
MHFDYKYFYQYDDEKSCAPNSTRHSDILQLFNHYTVDAGYKLIKLNINGTGPTNVLQKNFIIAIQICLYLKYIIGSYRAIVEMSNNNIIKETANGGIATAIENYKQLRNVCCGYDGYFLTDDDIEQI